MKKIFSLALALVMLTALFVPTTSFAALQWSAIQRVNLEFSSFKKNANNVTGSDYLNNKTTSVHNLTNAGTAADYEPVTGVFGKAADDTSVKITRIVSSTATSGLYVASMQPGGATAAQGATPAYYMAPGDEVVINWNWAFGDMNVDRSLAGNFYKNTSGYWGDNARFNYNANTTDSTILNYSPDGDIKLFGAILSDRFFAETNRWYNFEVRITNGNTSTQTKCKAKLYIDGIFMGSTDIYAAGSVYQMNGIYWMYFKSSGVKYEDSELALPETTYIDDIKTGYFKTNAANDDYVEFHQSLELTSKSDAYLTDKIHIKLKNDMTVEEFKNDVSYNKRTSSQTGITEVTILKDDWSAAESSDTIQAGWYARIKVEGDWISSSSRNAYRYYYRKFVDEITYANASYEGTGYNLETANPDGFSGLKLEKSGWSNTNSYGYVASQIGLKSDNRYLRAITQGPDWAINEMWLRLYDNKHTLPDKYTVEFSILRQNTTGDYPYAVFSIEGVGSLFILRDNDIILGESASATKLLWNKEGKLTNRWIKVATEVDTTTNKVKLYVNGEYTGIERNTYTKPFTAGGRYMFELGGTIAKNSKGAICLDDIKVYSGIYNDGKLDVTSTDNALSLAASETITVEGDISVSDFKAATGAVQIYTYSDGNFVSEVTTGNVADGNVAVFKNNDGIIRYLDIELLPVVSDVTFTEEGGKVKATVTVENRCENHVITSGLLVIANRSNDEVYAVNLDQKNDISALGTHTFTADVDYAEGDSVIAYFWDKNLEPFDNSKAVYTK